MSGSPLHHGGMLELDEDDVPGAVEVGVPATVQFTLPGRFLGD